MTVIYQLVQFIFFKREVKDIDYSPTYASLFFLITTAFLVQYVYIINSAGPNNQQVLPNIQYVPYTLVILANILFAALYYSLFAALEKQERFVQASTAFFGNSVILSVVAVTANLIPSGILIAVIAQGLNIACSIRVTMQALDYSVFRSFFSLIGIYMLAFIIAALIFPPVPVEGLLAE